MTVTYASLVEPYLPPPPPFPLAPRQPPEQWRSQPQPTAVPVQQPRGDLIYNKDEAWNYYQQFVKVGTEWHIMHYAATG